MPKPKISVIYLDMDGVICNFLKRYIELFGVSPDGTKNSKEFDGQFSKFIVEKNFETLELMPDAMLLIEYLRKAPIPTHILSSTGTPRRYDEVSKQKMIWLQTHGITFNPIFVPGKQLKKNYAKEDALIIDDTVSVIDDFRQTGGHAIWHNNVPATLAMLKVWL
jgi:hypothetical protein